MVDVVPERKKPLPPPAGETAADKAAILPGRPAESFDTVTIAKLLDSRGDESAEARKAAAHFNTLVKDQREAVISALIRISGSPSQNVMSRMDAFNALSEINPARAIAAAEQAAKNPATSEQAHCALAFLARAESADVAKMALTSLCSMKDDQAAAMAADFINNKKNPEKLRALAQSVVINSRQPTSEDDMKQMAKSFPAMTLGLHGRYSDRPFAEAVVNIALQQDPTAAYKSFGEHKNVDLLVQSEQPQLAVLIPAEDAAKTANLKAAVTGTLPEPDKERVRAAMIQTGGEVAMLGYLPGDTQKGELLADPLLGQTFKTSKLLETTKPELTLRDKMEQSLILTRNIALAGKSPDKGSVEQAVEDLAAIRQAAGPVEFFKGRQVVLAAHGEMVAETKKRDGSGYSAAEIAEFETQSGDKHRFGKAAAFQEIDRQAKAASGGSAELIRPEANSEKELTAARTKMLDAIRGKSSARGFTFVFDGHGGPDAIYISQGEIVEVDGKQKVNSNAAAVKITDTEFSAAIEERYKRFPDLANRPLETSDIFVFASCFGQNFIRSVSSKLEGKSALPIMISAGEFGQFAFSNMESPFGSRFFSGGIGLDAKQRSGDSSKIGDLIDRGSVLNSNPTIFIPLKPDAPVKLRTKDQKTIQLAQSLAGESGGPTG